MAPLNRFFLLPAMLLAVILLFYFFGSRYTGLRSRLNSEREGCKQLVMQLRLSAQRWQLQQQRSNATKQPATTARTETYALQQSLQERIDFIQWAQDWKASLQHTTGALVRVYVSIETHLSQIDKGQVKADAAISSLFDQYDREAALLQEKLEKLETILENEIETVRIIMLASTGFGLLMIGFLLSFSFQRRRQQQLLRTLNETKTSESLLRTIIDTSEDWMLVLDNTKRIRLINHAMAVACGQPAAQLKGSMLDRIDDLACLLVNGKPLSEFFISLKGRQQGEITLSVRGKEAVYAYTHLPLRNNEDTTWGTLLYLHDISERVAASHRLRKSEEEYRQLFLANPFPMWIFDRETLRFLEVNDMAVQHYGFSRREFDKMTILDIRPAEERAKVLRVSKEAKQEDKNYKPGTFVHHKKDGERIFVQITSHRMQYSGRNAMLVLAKDITADVTLQQQLTEEKVNQQKAIAKATIDVQEEERKIIGRELHDNVNQILTSAKLQLEYLDQVADRDRLVNNSIRLIATAINEIRQLSRSLVPPSIKDVGLLSSIADLIDNLNCTKSIFHFSHHNIDEKLLDEGVKLTVFRTVQELTTNIIKYAEAATASVALFREKDLLILKVRDDGKGFNLGEQRKGIGLSNVMNRVEIYHGNLTIRTAPGSGCEVMIRFNLRKLAAAKKI